MVYMINVWY